MKRQKIWLLAIKIMTNLADNRRKSADQNREYLEFWRARSSG